MESIFLRVLDMSVSAAVVIAVVILLRLVLRNAPKKWRYLLWSAAGFRLACPVSFRAAFSLFRLRPAAVSAPAAAVGAGELRYIPRAAVTAAPAITNPVTVTGVPIRVTADAISVQAAAPAVQAASANSMQVLLTVGTALWLAGLALMLALGVVRYFRMKGRLADAAKLEDGVFASDAVSVPFILGLLPPRIYVPAGPGLGGKEQDYVLAHERAHLRRFDHWVKLLSYVLLSLHWFNPLVWLAFYLMSRDMEMSCDERVLASFEGEAKEYSRTLLSFAAGKHFPAPAPLGFGESDVKSRIKNALRWRKPKLWVTVIAVVLCLAAIAACTANPSSQWLKDDDAVLEYAMKNYQIEGKAITGGRYLDAGGLTDGSVAYKRFMVELEDGTTWLLTVNGSLRKHLRQVGPEMQAERQYSGLALALVLFPSQGFPCGSDLGRTWSGSERTIPFRRTAEGSGREIECPAAGRDPSRTRRPYESICEAGHGRRDLYPALWQRDDRIGHGRRGPGPLSHPGRRSLPGMDDRQQPSL